MKHVIDQTFNGQSLVLDGHRYEGCTFRACKFVYAGHAGFDLIGNNISTDCEFEFTGCAGSAVMALRAIYSIGPWGRNPP